MHTNHADTQAGPDTGIRQRELSAEHYDNMGALSTEPTRTLDLLRYRLVMPLVRGRSVLDVGAYRGDFLKILPQGIDEMWGTEINQTRVAQSNELLGRQVVRLDFRNARLTTFDDDSVDTVTCMEVFEHLLDDRRALRELLRVARQRVIITVPFNEKIRYCLCVHCGRPTPHSGHVRSYTVDSFHSLAETCPGAKLTQCRPLGHKWSGQVAKVLGVGAGTRADRLLSGAYPRRSKWLLALFDLEPRA